MPLPLPLYSSCSCSIRYVTRSSVIIARTCQLPRGQVTHYMYCMPRVNEIDSLHWGLQPMEAERERERAKQAGIDRDSRCSPSAPTGMISTGMIPCSRGRGGMLVMMTNIVNSNYDDLHSIFTFTRHHRIYALIHDRI